MLKDFFAVYGKCPHAFQYEIPSSIKAYVSTLISSIKCFVQDCAISIAINSISPWTKWLLYHRQHFHEKKVLNFDSNFIEICP